MIYKIYNFFLKFTVKPFLNSKIKLLYVVGLFNKHLLSFLFKIDINHNAIIGDGVKFNHFIGIVIGESIIGKNCIIRQNTTIGRKSSKSKKYPIIGNNVEIGCNVVILGDIKIGDNSIIGAGTIVINNVPANSIVVGNPGRILPKK